MRPLLSGHPALDEVWVAPRLRPAEFFSGSNPATLRRLVRQLRARPFDLVVDLQGLLKSAVWVALARSPRKVGYDRTRELSYLALTERVAPFDPEAHAVRRYLNLAHYLGAPPAPPRFRLGLDAAADISPLLPGDETRGPWRCSTPGPAGPPNSGPRRPGRSLAEWLSREQGFQVAVTGSAADRELAAEILRSMPGAAAQSGRAAPPWRSWPRCLRQARLAVTTDTGAMHLAAALGTPVAALFGPTAPWRTGPFGDGPPGGAPGAAVQPLL